MANSKISALTSATTPLAGTETLPVVQSSATTKVTVANLTAGRSVSGSNFVVTSSTIPANGVYLPAANSVGVATNSTLQATFDASGNFGLGVTPSAWLASSQAIQNGSGSFWQYINASIYVGQNYYLNSSTQRIYSTTAAATEYQQTAGAHRWFNAPSGTAGNIITFTQAMTLNPSGNLAIGTTTISAGYGGGNGSLTLQNAKSVAFNNASDAWSTTTTGGAITYFTDNNLYIDAKDSASNMIFRVNGATERLRIASTGNITFTTGNVVQGTAAKGIDFSANTPAAGKTSTVLNWYEEGTWTPNQGAGLTLVGAFSSTGKYTRVGRNVTVSGTVTGATSVAVTAAGVVTSNLPFTIGTAGHGNATNAANTAFAAVICNTGTTLTSAGAIAATGTITFSATYFV
jgi:hypothetical protein